jgi:hypothetical protein
MAAQEGVLTPHGVRQETVDLLQLVSAQVTVTETRVAPLHNLVFLEAVVVVVPEALVQVRSDCQRALQVVQESWIPSQDDILLAAVAVATITTRAPEVLVDWAAVVRAVRFQEVLAVPQLHLDLLTPVEVAVGIQVVTPDIRSCKVDMVGRAS